MKRRRILLSALVAIVAVPTASIEPASATGAVPTVSIEPASSTEVCLAGWVLDQTLPGCNHCPPGVSFGPSGVNPFVSVFVCARP
jgi:hypothetical protein